MTTQSGLQAVNIASWKLNEVSTGVAPVSRLDQSGNSRTLTDTNNAPSASDSIGSITNVLSVNGSQTLDSSNSAFQLGGTAYSISLWVKDAGSSTDITYYIGKFGGTGGGEYLIGHYQSSGYIFRIYIPSAGTFKDVFSSINPTGGWDNLVCYDDNAGTIAIAVNGGSFSTNTYTGSNITNSSNMQVGGYGQGGSQLPCKLAYVNFFSRNVTTTEKDWLYANPDLYASSPTAHCPYYAFKRFRRI